MTVTPDNSSMDTGYQVLIREATKADDAHIRAQMRRSDMPGRVSLAVSHDPSFFESIEVDGYAHRVIVAEQGEQIVGVTLTTKRLAYLNGIPTDIGHISNLRIDPSIRNTTALARGIRLFRQWHDEDPATPPFYICAILQDNERARQIITSGRAGLPTSHEIGMMYTAAIPLLKRPRSRLSNGLAIMRGGAVGVEAIIEFLNRVGPEKQFFPVYTVHDLLARDGILRGLELNDFHIALAGDRIVGTMACWNQMPFRRIVVTGYAGSMCWLKPMLSPIAQSLGLAPLPNPGDPISSALAACIVIKDNSPEVFKALLSSVLQTEYGTGKTFLLVGLMECDPLLAVARRYIHLPTRSDVYALEWKGAVALAELDGRLPYLELGSL